MLVGNLYRSFSSKSHLIQSGPGLKEFVGSGSLLNGTTSVANHQLDDRVPYLAGVDVGGHGRRGMPLCLGLYPMGSINCNIITTQE